MSGKNQKNLLGLFRKNTVLISGISLIIGIHWGWWKIQQNPDLVDSKDRREFPLYSMYKKLSEKLLGDDSINVPANAEHREALDK